MYSNEQSIVVSKPNDERLDVPVVTSTKMSQDTALAGGHFIKM
jgi:hypothetical protein